MVNDGQPNAIESYWKASAKINAGKRLTARSKLLEWASAVVGLPLSNINQVQNGAVFCYILSAFGELDVSHVQFLAIEEQEYSANYRLLQAAGISKEMSGLNSRAKLRHWLRLAHSEPDAWQFLALLRIRFAGMKRQAPRVTIEPDTTPPPPPIPPKKGMKRGPSTFSTTSSVNSTGQCWREVDFSSTSGSSEGFFHSSRLADTLSTAQMWHESGVTADNQVTQPAKLPQLDKYAETPSTQRARTCLMQMLSQTRSSFGVKAGVST